MAHWMGLLHLWGCQNWCSLLSLTPKSSYLSLLEGNFTSLMCYWHWTWPDLLFFTQNHHWDLPSTQLFKLTTIESCPRTSWFHVSRNHTTETLDQLDKALCAFNNNWEIFIDLKIHLDFNFLKAHFMGHYHELIECYGTADNFNTEYTEQLHIDFMKDAYCSTNTKDEYPQMTAWLDWCEWVICHDKFIQRCQAAATRSPDCLLPHHLSSTTQVVPCILPLIYPHTIKMAIWATVHGVSLADVNSLYGASQFKAALSCFVIHFQSPQLPRRQVEHQASKLHIPFQKLSIFHCIKYISQDPFSTDPLADTVVDSIHCEPARHDKYGNIIPGRFDTAVINV